MPLFCFGYDGRRQSPFPNAPAPSMIRITIGVASPLIFGPVSVITSTPVFSQMVGDATWAKTLPKITLNQRMPKSGSAWNDMPSSSENRGGMDPLVTHYNIWLCWVLTSRKENKCNNIRI